MGQSKPPRDRVALILAYGAVSLVLVIAVGSFGRAFFLAVVTHEDHPISDAATQLLTGLGSALVGGAVGFIGGTNTKTHSLGGIEELDPPTNP